MGLAESGSGEPRRDPCLADDIHFRAFLDQQLEQSVPSPVGWAEESILIEGGHTPGTHTQIQQKLHCLDRLLLGNGTFTNQTIQGSRRHHCRCFGSRHQFGIRSGF